MHHKPFHSNHGFTIIELLVVVVVIGILATIVILSGTTYIKNSAETTVQSNLQSAATKLRTEKSKAGGYPTTQTALNNLVKSSSDVTLTLVAANSTEFCVKATSSKYSDIIYYMSHDSTEPSTTDCTSAVTPPPPPPPPPPEEDAITATPSTYDYGTFSAANGRTPYVTFTLTNTSDEAVKIYTVNGTSSGSDTLYYSFSFVTCASHITLQPGGSCTLKMNFGNYINPPHPIYGTKNAYLRVILEDPDGSSGESYNSVQVTGNLTP